MGLSAEGARFVKRYGNLWPEVIAFDNLVAAALKAQRGKRYRGNVLEFNANIEVELEQIQAELISRTYTPGAYRTFLIYEPKKRMISAAPYRDRVVHHALCNVIVPIFEKTLIDQTYANRVGYGTHRALQRFTFLARSRKYVLQCDIRQYFPSIDHEILKGIIRRKIKCAPTLWLIDRIIDASNEQDGARTYFPGDDLFSPFERRQGLPIGNLTSQFFANLYLSGFDHFIQERMSWARYVRYVDDFALFSDDKQKLEAARPAIEAYLAGLRLRLHPVKSQITATSRGPAFTGFRVLPEQIRVRTDNLRRSRRRLRRYQKMYASGEMSAAKVRECLRSWIAHLQHGDTWRLRQRVFTRLVFRRNPEASV